MTIRLIPNAFENIVGTSLSSIVKDKNNNRSYLALKITQVGLCSD